MIPVTHINMERRTPREKAEYDRIKMLIISLIEDKILEVADMPDMTRSDLQGVAGAAASEIFMSAGNSVYNWTLKHVQMGDGNSTIKLAEAQ